MCSMLQMKWMEEWRTSSRYNDKKKEPYCISGPEEWLEGHWGVLLPNYQSFCYISFFLPFLFFRFPPSQPSQRGFLSFSQPLAPSPTLFNLIFTLNLFLDVSEFIFLSLSLSLLLSLPPSHVSKLYTNNTTGQMGKLSFVGVSSEKCLSWQRNDPLPVKQILSYSPVWKFPKETTWGNRIEHLDPKWTHLEITGWKWSKITWGKIHRNCLLQITQW